MTTQTAHPSRLAQVARVLLTFILVFGMSFRVEMAFAAIDEVDLKGYEEKTLTNLTVKAIKDDKIGDAVRSLVEMKDDKNKDGITLDYGASIKLAAVPEWEGKEEKAIAKFVEWDVDGKKSTDAMVEVSNNEAAGGTVTVKCSIAKDNGKYLADALGGTREIVIPVTLSAQPAAETTKKANNATCVLVGEGLAEGENSITLTKEQGAEYTFEAKVSADIDTVDAEGNILETAPFSYTSKEGQSLSAQSDGLLSDLQWSLLDKNGNAVDEDIATIADGVLAVKQDSSFTVRCTVVDAEGVNSSFYEVAVVCGEPGSDDPDPDSGSDDKEPDQGDETRHQDTLTISGCVPSSALVDGETIDDPDEESKSTSSESAGERNEAIGDEFQLEDFDGYFREEGKYHTGVVHQMYSGNDGQVSIEGEGVTLKDLLAEMFVDPDAIDTAIEEVQFISDDRSAVTLSWSSISGGSDSPLVATRSLVSALDSDSNSGSEAGDAASNVDGKTSEGDASNDSEGENAPSDGPKELKDNTRFRILFEDAASDSSSAIADADKLRYISEIVINPSLVPSEPEQEDPDAPFSVSISYAAAPIGQQAVFSPILSEEIAGMTFDFAWYESADGGENWTKVGEDQTYRTITTKERLGHLIKVVVSSEGKDKETGETVKYKPTESDPVTITEGDEFVVQLIYDPPFAGDMAVFKTHVTDAGKDVDASKLSFTWQITTDGGKTWEGEEKYPILGQFKDKPTLSIKTDPIDESDAWQENTTLTYVRVVVAEKTGKKREKPSNAQLLTVKTGKKEGEPVPISDPKPKPEKTTTDGNKNPNPNVPSDTVNTPKPTETTGDEPTDEAPQLYIDEEVTQQILEQEQAEQEYVEATVPGARWTTLAKSGDEGDEEDVLGDNPFAPLAVPVSLGVTAAGGLEKLLFFRRQL